MNIKNKNGFALIATYFVLIILTIMSIAFLSQSVSEKLSAEHYTMSNQAFWVADGGMQKAIWDLNNNNCSSCQACGPNQCLSGTILGSGDYDVVIDSINNTISSTGSTPSRLASNVIQRKIIADLSGGTDPFFTHAIYANDQIDISNNVSIDSYDSSLGLYNISGNINSNGDIGSNGTSTNAIDISNNAYIAGDVETGAGGTVHTSNNATITGTISDTANKALDPVMIPTTLTTMTSLGNKTVSNNGSWIVNSGSYRYDEVTLKNNVAMTVSGNVTIYVSGNFNVKNNVDITITPGSSLTYYTGGKFQIKNNATVNNMTKIPANFVIYSAYSGNEGILFENNGDFYGAVYAPDTNITIENNANGYGAFVGDTVELSNNAEIHYDEDLMNAAGGSGAPHTISNWQEF